MDFIPIAIPFIILLRKHKTIILSINLIKIKLFNSRIPYAQYKRTFTITLD